jgi:inosose dehydratase
MSSSEISVANAPCSWGVLEFGAHAPTYGSADVLDQIASTGYQGTELGDWGFMPTDPAVLHDELERRALALVGAFVPVALADARAHAGGVAAALRTGSLMRDAGHSDGFIVLADETDGNTRRVAVAGRVTPADGLSPHQWNVAAQGATAVASAVREQTGLRTVIHPHCGSFVETEAEIDALLARVDPELLGLCLDTGHVMYGGGDPLSVYSRHAGRVWHVHLKDCEPGVAAEAVRERVDYFEAVRRGVFCELGRGAVDFRAVVSALQRQRYRGWVVVEQDVLPSLGTPAASAERNRAYLRSIGV